MQVLNLGGNKFGDYGSEYIAKCIHKLEELKLIDCNIGARGVELLAHGIIERNQPVGIMLILIVSNRA